MAAVLLYPPARVSSAGSGVVSPLFWLSDKAWAAIEPRLATKLAQQTSSGRPLDIIGHLACAEGRVLMARRADRV